MARQDDPALSGALVVYRRIPPFGNRCQWPDDGSEPHFSSMNFSDDDDEMSVYLETETTPQRVIELGEIAGCPGCGIATITLGEIRSICGADVIIFRDDVDRSDGHVLVFGNIKTSVRKKLQKAARWLPGHFPTRPSG